MSSFSTQLRVMGSFLSSIGNSLWSRYAGFGIGLYGSGSKFLPSVIICKVCSPKVNSQDDKRSEEVTPEKGCNSPMGPHVVRCRESTRSHAAPAVGAHHSDAPVQSGMHLLQRIR